MLLRGVTVGWHLAVAAVGNNSCREWSPLSEMYVLLVDRLTLGSGSECNTICMGEVSSTGTPIHV